MIVCSAFFSLLVFVCSGCRKVRRLSTRLCLNGDLGPFWTNNNENLSYLELDNSTKDNTELLSQVLQAPKLCAESKLTSDYRT